MTDIALRYDPNLGGYDIDLDGPDLATDDGLETAVLVSWGTDKRAPADADIPDGTDNRRGFWGDAFPAVEGDQIGSLFWLLGRSKTTVEVLRLAKDYGEEALKWMIEDGVAALIEVVAERVQLEKGTALKTTAVITRPDGRIVKYDYVWEALNGL